METFNPYSPPAEDCRVSRRPAKHFNRRRFAMGFLIISIGSALAYTYLDEVVFRTSYGAWPMLWATSAISIVASITTNHRILSPLCCFAATIAGDILAGLVRGWQYAQVHLCIPLAIGFSIPAIVLVALFGRRLTSD